MQQGIIRRYFDDRGYGFLQPDSGGSDLFFHVRAFTVLVEPKENQRVEYDVAIDRNGREQAKNLRLMLND